ncbi:MAG: class I SAM-dependent methyltransferase [Planctomycetota bacterium]|jgi:SAM-dependent methyltransferase
MEESIPPPSGENAWYEDVGFWRAASASLFGDEAWHAAAADSGQLVALLGLEPGASVLDLGCGPGRYALPLAGLGYAVTGVDRTAPYLDEARKRADEAELEIELVLADMREFRRPAAFDAAISMLTSFGYFEDPEEDLQVLRNVLDSLKPGGALLIDTVGKEILGRIFQARDWKRVGDEIWLFERRPVRAWSWMDNTWTRIRDGQAEEFEIGHRLFSAVELASMARGAGFAETAAYGDLQGSAYDETATRLVVVARKTD